MSVMLSVIKSSTGRRVKLARVIIGNRTSAPLSAQVESTQLDKSLNDHY